MVRGPRAGLGLLDALGSDPRIAGDHRLLSVRAHLLERAGEYAAAREAYEAAARRTTSVPQQRYLYARAAAARDRPDTDRPRPPGGRSGPTGYRVTGRG